MPEPYGPFEIDDETWDLMSEAMNLKLESIGKAGDMPEFLVQLKAFYKMPFSSVIIDTTALKQYIAATKLNKLLAVQEELDTESQLLAAQIAELQAFLNP